MVFYSRKKPFGQNRLFLAVRTPKLCNILIGLMVQSLDGRLNDRELNFLLDILHRYRQEMTISRKNKAEFTVRLFRLFQGNIEVYLNGWQESECLPQKCWGSWKTSYWT